MAAKVTVKKREEYDLFILLDKSSIMVKRNIITNINAGISNTMALILSS